MVTAMTNAPTFQIARQQTETRPNRYGGNCTNCRGYVEADAGLLGPKTAEGKWTVMHITCPAPEPVSATTAPTQVEPGIYIDGEGAIWKVQQNKAKTSVYAKVWSNHNGERLTLGGEKVHGEWDYVPGGIRTASTARRMTLDEAKAFILLYGSCVRCGRTLKAAESVERGIGPVCITYFNQFA